MPALNDDDKPESGSPYWAKNQSKYLAQWSWVSGVTHEGNRNTMYLLLLQEQPEKDDNDTDFF